MYIGAYGFYFWSRFFDYDHDRDGSGNGSLCSVGRFNHSSQVRTELSCFT